MDAIAFELNDYEDLINEIKAKAAARAAEKKKKEDEERRA